MAKVGSDLFELKGVHYLLVVDYFSRFVEVSKMCSTTSTSIILVLKSIFSRYGIPMVFVSDMGLSTHLRNLNNSLMSTISCIPQAVLTIPKEMD